MPACSVLTESGKSLVVLTSNTALPILTMGALYKSRWQIERFFKWIKQHLRIKHFLGVSENAVKTQKFQRIINSRQSAS